MEPMDLYGAYGSMPTYGRFYSGLEYIIILMMRSRIIYRFLKICDAPVRLWSQRGVTDQGQICDTDLTKPVLMPL